MSEIEKCALCGEPLTLDNLLLLGEELGFCLNNYCSLEAGLTANELRAIRAAIEAAERRGLEAGRHVTPEQLHRRCGAQSRPEKLDRRTVERCIDVLRRYYSEVNYFDISPNDCIARLTQLLEEAE